MNDSEENPAPVPKAKKSRPLLWGCAGLVAFFLLIVITVSITVWWIQRPIRPVILTSQERVAVDGKMKELEGGTIPLDATKPSASPAATPVPVDPRAYVPGGKVLKLTEREINGLLNLNTELGDKVRLEFGQDAVNAYMAIPIPEDFPVAAGTTIRMRGRFRVSIGGEGKPFAILEDITIFGISLPKDWLGGIKGENLIGDVLGEGSVVQGIKSLKVEPGALVIEVED
jgi:hypothetical protein